jgi:hypothetical protein
MNIRGVFVCVFTQCTCVFTQCMCVHTMHVCSHNAQADVLKIQYLVNQEKQAHAIISHKQTVQLKMTQLKCTRCATSNHGLTEWVNE